MSAKARISKAVTTVLKKFPEPVKGMILRKAIAIADDRTRFLNWQITMIGSISNIREAGLNPAGVIDIGANVGNWTREVSKIFPSSRIHMIEAQAELECFLCDTAKEIGDRVTYGIGLLGSTRDAGVPFYKLGTGSSVFEEVTQLNKDVVILPVIRLDDVPEVKSMTGPIFLKLDVQGYELEVLKGASEVLSRTTAILMEVALLRYNNGAPLMPEVIAFMNDIGFVPYDFCGQLRRTSDLALFQTDIIFVRQESSLRAHRRFSEFEPVY